MGNNGPYRTPGSAFDQVQVQRSPYEIGSVPSRFRAYSQAVDALVVELPSIISEFTRELGDENALAIRLKRMNDTIVSLMVL